MKHLALATGILALAAPLALAQTSTWAIDGAHSEVNFTVVHMSVSNVHGRIGGLKGNITLNEADVTKSTVSVTIDTTTTDTGVSMRDNDLKGANFLDATAFPTATFTSTGVAKAAGGLTVTGTLTLHGVTKPVTLAVTGPVGPTPSGMDHKLHAGYSATTTIKRADFGIAPKMPGAAVSDDVKLSIDLEVVKQ